MQLYELMKAELYYISKQSIFLCLLLARAGFTWLMHSDHVYVL